MKREEPKTPKQLKEDREIANAIKVIKEGGVILYPTDTVWGIGCDATNAEAVSKVFKIKEREESKSLVILVADTDMLAKYVQEIPAIALDLIEINTSPMTIIYPEAIFLAENVIAEDRSVGIRIPMSDFCRRLSYKARLPLVSTSANISGEKTPKTFKEIPDSIKEQVDYIIHPSIEEKSATKKPSQIIKLGVRGEVEVIRK